MTENTVCVSFHHDAGCLLLPRSAADRLVLLQLEGHKAAASPAHLPACLADSPNTCVRVQRCFIAGLRGASAAGPTRSQHPHRAMCVADERTGTDTRRVRQQGSLFRINGCCRTTAAGHSRVFSGSLSSWHLNACCALVHSDLCSWGSCQLHADPRSPIEEYRRGSLLVAAARSAGEWVLLCCGVLGAPIVLAGTCFVCRRRVGYARDTPTPQTAS